MCEKQKLEKISKSDPCTLAYVFYMKSERTRNTTFESALHTGWFIQIVSDTEKVEMVKTDGPREDKFFHIIIQSQKAWNKLSVKSYQTQTKKKETKSHTFAFSVHLLLQRLWPFVDFILFQLVYCKNVKSLKIV